MLLLTSHLLKNSTLLPVPVPVLVTVLLHLPLLLLLLLQQLLRVLVRALLLPVLLPVLVPLPLPPPSMVLVSRCYRILQALLPTQALHSPEHLHHRHRHRRRRALEEKALCAPEASPTLDVCPCTPVQYDFRLSTGHCQL